jgi:hypothetical protein
MSAAGADPHGERTGAARADQLISYLDNLDPVSYFDNLDPGYRRAQRMAARRPGRTARP